MERRNNSDYVKETGVGTYTYPFPAWGLGVLDSTGNPFSADVPDIQQYAFSDVEKEVLENYGLSSWADLYPSKEEIPKSEWGEAWNIPIPEESGVYETLTICDNLTKNALIEMIVSDPNQFDELWDKYQQDLMDAGVEEMNKAFTELVKQRVDLWRNN
jgi:putative aldouronate transport system substrate-binding protein